MAGITRWYLKKQGSRLSLGAWVVAAAFLVLAAHHVITVLSFASGSYRTQASVIDDRAQGRPRVVFTGSDGARMTVRLEHWLSAESYAPGSALEIYVRSDEPWRVLELSPGVLWRRPVLLLLAALGCALAAMLLQRGLRRLESLDEHDLARKLAGSDQGPS
jgi:hypothetical protein